MAGEAGMVWDWDPQAALATQFAVWVACLDIECAAATEDECCGLAAA